MSKEAIVSKILDDAKFKAKAMVGEAKIKADETLANAKASCDDYKKKSKSEIDTIVSDILARSKTVAELDNKKKMLGAKALILNKVFERVLDKMKELDAKEYKALLLGMLNSAEDGDVITISKREEKILTKSVVDEFAKSKGIKLTLNSELGDFDGGIILSSKGVDKNMTFDVEVSLLREEIEMQIAKELFG